MLRDGALSDKRVVELVRERFVPVWIDIRTTPIPDVPALHGSLVLKRSEVDAEGRVSNAWSKGFFVRSIVLAPDGRTLLNSESAYWGGGNFPFAQTKADDYLPMLSAALARHEQVSGIK